MLADILHSGVAIEERCSKNGDDLAVTLAEGSSYGGFQNTSSQSAFSCLDDNRAMRWFRLRVLLFLSVSLAAAEQKPAAAEHKRVAVIVSANAEWREVKKFYPRVAVPGVQYQTSPYGEYFLLDRDTVVFHGGWGKISAAASAQYVIDRWNPAAIVNLGTCGGIAGRIDRFTTVLVTKTVVYDIVEQMGDASAAIQFYSTDIDLRWLPGRLPMQIVRAPLYSGDRDLVAQELPTLIRKYGAVAADWESGAIAWVARRNGKRVLILRGVSDLVTPSGGEAYGKTEVFEQGTARVMQTLLDSLPQWLALLPR